MVDELAPDMLTNPQEQAALKAAYDLLAAARAAAAAVPVPVKAAA